MPVYTYEEVLAACIEYFHGDKMAAKAVATKYLLKDRDGKFVENTPNDYLAYRLPREFHRIEKKYPNPLTLEEIRAAFGGISNEELEAHPEKKSQLGYGEIVPQGSPTFGVGNDNKVISLSNCFCLGQPLDSYAGIFLKDQEIAQVQKRRGGCGIDVSTLRPRGTLVKNAALTSDGIPVFMERFSNTTLEVAQGGRRGALLVSIDCRHPDIMLFINAKKNKEKIQGANISVKWHDDFFEALEKKGKYTLRFPVDVPIEEATTVVEVDAQEVWNSFIDGAWEWAEPGCFYWDTMVGQSITDVYAKEGFRTCGTNPCISGSIPVYVADGRGNVTIKQLADEGNDVPVFCYDDNGKIVIRTMRNPRVTGFKKKIYKVTLDDGSVIRCTGNHKIRLTDGTYQTVNSLIKGDGVKILTRFEASIKDIFPKANSNSQDYFWINNGFSATVPEHRVVSSHFEGRELVSGEVVHHKDRDGRNNSPSNLLVMSKSDHDKLHCENMIGDKNPMRRAEREWSEEKWRQYGENMSEAVRGEKNGRYLNVTNDELLEKADELTRCLGRKFSSEEWAKYAKTNRLPIAFSDWRKGVFGSVPGLAKISAMHCGYEYIDEDPRLIKSFLRMVEMGYNTTIDNHKVMVSKTCERCGADFKVEHILREISFCSQKCAVLTTMSKKRIEMIQNTQLWYKNRSIDLKRKQCEMFTSLRFRLSRDPWRKEWEHECCQKGVPFRLGTKYGFKGYGELKETAQCYNHRVVSVEIDGEEDVYNGTVDEFHNFFVGAFESKTKNGKNKWVYVNNRQCGELPLSEYGSCILMLMNLIKFVDNPFTFEAKLDWNRFANSVKIGTRIIDDLVDLEIEKVDKIIEKVQSDPEPTHVKVFELSLWEKIREKLVNGRKTGLGVTGLGDMLAALNISYAGEDAVEFCDRLFGRFQEIVYEESAILAKERGAFPCWDWSKEKDNHYIQKLPKEIQALIKKHGRRNIANLTLSPAGTTSIATQTTSGVEPLYAHEVTRRRKMTQDEEEAGSKPDTIDDKGTKWVNEKMYHKGFEQWRQITGKSNFKDSPYAGSEALEIDPKFRVKLQGTIQKHIDSSISSTVNLAKTTTKEQVDELYRLGWRYKCKGLTIYRDGSRDGIFVTANVRPGHISESQSPKRPEYLKCEIHTSVIKGTQWVFMVGLLEARPYEIFGGKYSSMIIPKKFIKGHDDTDAMIRKNPKNSAGISTYDLIVGYATSSPTEYKDIAAVFSPDNGSPTRLISMLLRHGAPINDICEQIRKIPQEDSMLTFEKGLSRVLRKYVADKTKAKGYCPDCGSVLIYEGGCVKCSQCPWTRCE